MNQNRTDDERTTRIVTLDFNGGSHVYRNPELGMNIPVRIAPSGISADRAKMLADALNRKYADSHVRFEVGAGSSENASAVHIGRTDAFDAFGHFLGLAEGIGSGNAFVLLDASANDAELADVIRHEAGHILGMLDHGGAGLGRYAVLPDIVYTVYDHYNDVKDDRFVYGSNLWSIHTIIYDYYEYVTATSGEGKIIRVTEQPVYYKEVEYDYHADPDPDGELYKSTVGPFNAGTVSSSASGISVAGITVDGGSASGCTCSSYLSVSARQYYDMTFETKPKPDQTGTLTTNARHSNVRRTEGSASGCVAYSGSVTAGSMTNCEFGAGGLDVCGVYHYEADYSWEGIGTVPAHPELSYVTYGRASNCTIRDGGTLTVEYGGTASDIIITEGNAVIGCRSDIASLPVDTETTHYSNGRTSEEKRFANVGSVAGKATNLIVENGNVSVNYGGELHNVTVNGAMSVTEGGKAEGVISITGGLTARAGAVLNGAITCSGVDLSGVRPQAGITVKVDLRDYAVANFTEMLPDGTRVQYFANYTTRTYRYRDGVVISVTDGTFDNKDGRFNMKDWKYMFSIDIGSVDELSASSVTVDFGGTEKDFDEGEIGFFFPKTSEDSLPFQLKSDKRKYTITNAYYQGENDTIIEKPSGLLYNSALFGEAADVLWLEFGEDEDVEYTIDLASMMSGATEELTITNADTGKETLTDAKIQGATLIVKGDAETADLVVSAEDSNKRDYECDLELIVVPEEIPIIGKEGTKKYAALLKKAQAQRLTTINDVLPYNIHTKLFGMAFDLTNMGISLTVNWTAPSMTLKLQGKMEWAIGKGGAGTGKQMKLVVDLSGDNYISITSSGGKQYSWDIVGEIKVPDFNIGKFAFSNMVLKVNKGQASFSASAYVQLPWIKYSFGGSIGIVDGYLDSMSIGVDSLNIPLGGTGLFLQKIEGGIKGIATELNLSFEGTLGLTAGPKFKVEFVDWLGLDNGVYSLCEMTLTGSISTSGDLEGSSSFVILGGLATGSGSASLKGGELTVKGTYTFLNSCISVKGELHASTGGITIEGTGTATVPREKYFGPLAGYSMSANVAAEVRTSASDSFVMAWQNITIFNKEYTIGFKSTFEGKVSMLGSTDLLKKEEMDSSLRSLRSISVPSASVAAPLRGEATPSASEKYLVSDSGLTFFQVYLSVSGASMSLAYGDTEYTQADIAAGNCENMQIVSELSGETWITVAVDNAALGEWTINAYGDANATFSAYTVLSGVQIPVLTSVSIGEDARSATLRYTADLSDLTNATLSIFRMSAGSTEYNGSKIAELSADEATGVYEYVMPDEVEGGEYSFYLAVNSDGHTPVYSTISDAYTFRELDLEAPDRIQIVNSEWKSSGTVLTWDEPWDDNGVAGYKVSYRMLIEKSEDEETGCEELSGEAPESGSEEVIEEEIVWTEADVKTNTFTFDSVPNGTYVYRIAACDEAGNLGAWSEEQSCLVLTVANAKYKDVTLTESILLDEYESTAGITAGGFTVTAASNSLVSGAVLGNAEIGGIMENSTVNGDVSLLEGGTAYDTAVNGGFTVNGTGDGITVAAGGQLTIENGGKARDITVEAGGLISLMPGSEFENLTLAYGAGLIVAGGKNGNYRLTDDIWTAGTLSTYRFISANGHKIHFEQYKQTAEYETYGLGADNTWDNVAFMSDMDKLIGNNALDVVIDSSVYGSFKIADSAEYFNGTITVTDSVDGSSATVGFDKLMLVGNALCQLTKNNDGSLRLYTTRSAIDAPTVTVEQAESNAYDTIRVHSTAAEDTGRGKAVTFRYSLNADMSDAVVVDATYVDYEGNGSLVLDKYGLVDNATYYIQATVENDNGVKSLWSDAVSFTMVPKLLPDAPTTLTVSNATDKNSASIYLKATGVDDSNYTVREYRFRYADNPEMKNAVVITTGQRLINYASIDKSTIEDGKDYYVQAGVKQLNDWSYWSDMVVFNTQGWDYDGITVGTGGDYEDLWLNGKRARNLTVTEGGQLYGDGAVEVNGISVNGGFFRASGPVSNVVVNSGDFWLYENCSVSDLLVNGGKVRLMYGSLNGATIGVNGTMDLSSSFTPTITGTILIQGSMTVYNYHPGLSTDASFVFNVGAHESETMKDKMFIDFTSPLLGSRTFTVKLDDTPEAGDYKLTYVPNSGEFYTRLVANDGTDLGLMSLGGEAIQRNGLYYALAELDSAVYLHVSENNGPLLIGKVKLSKDGTVRDSSNVYSYLTVSAASECDHVLVEDGGRLQTVTVGDGGSVDVFGEVWGATIEKGGKLTMNSGCVLADRPVSIQNGGEIVVNGGMINSGAKFTVGGKLTLNGALQSYENDGDSWYPTYHEFTFALDQYTAPNDAVLISDYELVKTCNASFSISVSANQADGVYKLMGNAASYNYNVTVYYEGGPSYGSYLYIGGNGSEINGKRYLLAVKDDILTLTIGSNSSGGDPEPPNPDEPDGNDNPVLPDGTLNPDAFLPINPLSGDSSMEIIMDAAGNDSGEYSNSLGGDDKVDSAQISLEKAAKLSFTVEADSKVKFTFYQLVENKKKPGTYTKKALKSVSVTKSGDSKQTASVLVEGGWDKLYYVAVENKNSQSKGAYYNVSLTTEGKNACEFFSDGDNGDNNILWNKTDKWNEKVHGEDVDALVIDGDDIGKSIQIDTDAETVVEHDGFTNFVGFGDAMDFRKIELKSAAKLSFDLAKTTGGAAKLVIYTENDKGKMVVANSKLTVTTKAAAPSGSVKNPVVLQKGVYYIAVQSTDAKKGKEAYYNVSLNANSVFYEHGDSNLNDFISKTKKVSAEVVANAKDLEIGAFQIDGILQVEGDSAVEYTDAAGKVYANFVGTGDTSDVVRINANDGMKLSLKVTATDAVSLVVYGLQKNGTLKALKTVKSKNNIAELNDFELKAKSAPGGQFFLGVTSTNAKKGSAAYYKVDVVSVSGQDLAPLSASEASSLSMSETDSLAITDSLSFGNYGADALAGASASSLANLDDKSAWLNIASLA